MHLLVSTLLWAVASASFFQFPFFRQQEADKQAPGNHSIARDFYLELEELSRLVDVSYCIGIQGPGIKEPFECPSRCKDFPTVKLVTTWNTGPMLSDSCGYIAIDEGNKTLDKEPRIIVAFRGTYSIANTVYDLSTIPQEYVSYPDDDNGSNPNATKCENCAVHMGFYASWKNTRNVILPVIEEISLAYPHHKLVLVGHSLGGAVAALAAMELLARGYDPTITTFGEPRVGNQGLVDFIDAQFGLDPNSTTDASDWKFRRVTHMADPVPHLPLEEWGYVPHGGEIFISKSDLPPDVEDLRSCDGQKDKECSTGPEGDWSKFPWGMPARFKIWELLWAHRDYFWRLGLCVSHDHDGRVSKLEF
jgi:pimeloyl-ACP methyl ester carboxylesterase